MTTTFPTDLTSGAGTGKHGGALPGDRALTAPRGRLRRIAGTRQRAAWERPALGALLAATALLYLWGLHASGDANSFYAAAVQAGTKSWKAFFFGSFDSSSFITVDKPPASLWVMELSGRVFGFSSWSMLVPQALEGVATVAVLYAAVRRWFSPSAALLAGAVLALTPVATLMFRFNNPDALLVLLLVVGAYCMVRALETAGTRWLLLAGAAVGFAFLSKALQAVVILPAFGLVYLVAAPTGLRRRVLQLLAGGAAMLAAGGWWVAVVSLWPASSRPYIGGSQDNSFLSLTFGYNGFGRLTGNESGSVGGGGGAGGTGRWGATGLLRMFNGEMGGQVSWLLPAALVAVVVLVVLAGRAPRTDRTRAVALLWGGWLVVTAATFSFAKGIVHPYYTVALAPAVGALVGVAGIRLWRLRGALAARLVLAGAVALTVVWSGVLLHRSPTWHPALRTAVLVVGVAAAVLLVVPALGRWGRWGRCGGVAVGTAALVASLAGPAAYSLETASTLHTGAIPSAGPAVAGGGFGGFGGAGARRFGPGGARGTFPGGFPGGAPPAGVGGAGAPGGTATGGTAGRRGGAGGLLDAATPAPALVALVKGSSGYTWAAAAVGANNAAGVEIATGKAVMALGGFNGTDPTPTLARFEALVAQHKVHYFLAGGGFGGRGLGRAGGTASTSSAITTWVESHFTATTVGGRTVYDLSQPVSAAAG